MIDLGDGRALASYERKLSERHKGFKVEQIEMMTNMFLRQIAIDDLSTAPDNCLALVISKDGQLVGKDVLVVKGAMTGASYFMEFGNIVPL